MPYVYEISTDFLNSYWFVREIKDPLDENKSL